MKGSVIKCQDATAFAALADTNSTAFVDFALLMKTLVLLVLNFRSQETN
jgi:hypothetical protein